MNIRRITTTLGALATAAVLGVAVPTSAQAAEGALYINDQAFTNPSGCYPIPHDYGQRARVLNYTNTAAVVFDAPDCTGSITRPIAPHEYADLGWEPSLLIP